MQFNHIWQKIHDELTRRHAAVLMIVVHSDASSPGRTGFKMVVTSHDLTGTIGGGVMEYQLVTQARQLLNDSTSDVCLKHLVHDPTKQDASGMICAGEQTVALVRLVAACLPVIEAFMSGQGTLHLSPGGLSHHPQPQSDRYVFHHDGDAWRYSESLSQVDTAYIIGSGHVGLALCRLLAQVGFYVIAFDERPEVDSFVNNVFAHEKHIVDYHRITEHIPEDNATYIVIMTHTHKLDQTVLNRLVDKRWCYLGLLGSRHKVDTVFANLRQAGVSDENLGRVHAPIGLKIHSKTAEEIAVSIAAEMILVKNTLK